MADDVELAYLAGFFDGEGCIHISRRKPKKSHQNPTYVVQVSVAQVNPEVLERFQRIWGAGIYVGTSSKSSRPQYSWRPSALVADEFLKDVLPYLSVKKQQAELAIFLQSQGRGKRSEVGEEVRLKVHELNGSNANFRH